MCIRDRRFAVEQMNLRPGERVLDLASGTGDLIRLMQPRVCLLYTSDAADERSSVDLGGRRIIKKHTADDEQRRYSLNITDEAVDK